MSEGRLLRPESKPAPWYRRGGEFESWEAWEEWASIEFLKRFEGAGQRTDRFSPLSAADLAGVPEPMQWLVESVWPDGAYGVYGGAKKTFKSYVTTLLAVAVASGRPFLNRFDVPQARPVLLLEAEGGRRLFQRRLQAVAQFAGIELADIPLHVVFDAAPTDSQVFKERMQQLIDSFKPGLVILDALYAFHPSGIEAQNLYERGSMLADLQRQIVAPDRALIVVDHFSKAASKLQKLDLDSISQSGVAEWSHSWILAMHREAARISEGEVRLRVEIGGRDGYGQDYEVDLSLGPLGQDGLNSGPLDVRVRADGGDVLKTPVDRVRQAILALLDNRPLELSRESGVKEVAETTTVGPKTVKARWNELAELGRIVSEPRRKREGNREVTRDLWRLADDEPAPGKWFAAGAPS